MFARSILASLALAGAANFAWAGDVTGVWLHEDGGSKVRFAPCGAAICGNVVWLKDTKGPTKIGERVFYDMTPTGDNAWTGKAFEPSSGKEYTGKMSLAGDSLTTAGCVLGGLICKSITWSRSQ
ncbi:MAG TPA: DUF2147 domain-containing protein [Roseiarcus sp.]|nr:DUF2147 domain-containing protein [Roseiarcus sp.]